MAEQEISDIDQLITELKSHLEENEGEIVYFGLPIADFGFEKKSTVVNPQPAIQNPQSKIEQLESLRTQDIGDCHLCPLGDTRIKIVFGVGNPEAQVLFVGEGPGFDEDRQGEPFVGKAGQLLDKIMAAIDLDRKKVYIANIVKCHPMVDPSQPEKRGNDRPPSPEEMEKCLPFLKKQIAIIRPKFIVTLGATATKALLGRREGITALRGKIFPTQLIDGESPIPVLPTFHPAALLRDDTLKKSVWEDMKKLRDALK
jgi:DNA polymerase